MRKTVIVTGGGSGIGLALATEFAKRQYLVFVVDLKYRDNSDVGLNNLGVKTFVGDVSSTEFIRDFKKELETKYSLELLDILYNNAGIGCPLPTVDIDDDSLERIFKVNTIAPIKWVREFHKLVIKARGIFAFTGSSTGDIPLPLGAAYSASKSALDQYVRNLHLELSPLGVKVVNVVSGPVDTNLADIQIPLAEESLFNTEEGREALRFRKTILTVVKSMPSETYAQRTIDQLDRATPSSLRLYEGSQAFTYSAVANYLPNTLTEKLIRSKYKLDPVYPAMLKKLNQ